MTDIQTITLTPWSGGECPVEDGIPTIVRFGNGEIMLTLAPETHPTAWRHEGELWSHITAYAVIRTEVAVPRVDRSARGLVSVTFGATVWYGDARDDGVYHGDSLWWPWEQLEGGGYTVRRLTAADLEVHDE